MPQTLHLHAVHLAEWAGDKLSSRAAECVVWLNWRWDVLAGICSGIYMGCVWTFAMQLARGALHATGLQMGLATAAPAVGYLFAVLWARQRLAASPARYRLLLVMSDGAPVDDATLMFNGPSILERHILRVVPEVEAEGLIIGGLGINYRVERYYPRSEAATALEDLPAAAVRILKRMLAAAAEREAAPA